MMSMDYRTLGQSGLKVSTLTLGSMMFGEQTGAEESLRIIDKARDQGINFIDTADV
ncbi:Aldo/keto reductase family oxidoreductase [Pseudomonas coronafaciens pv. coronafaciens]|nr:Aldo/keto reductase family oxidoreductase [Pseudomonas coronafaciens pv. coronafaciens]